MKKDNDNTIRLAIAGFSKTGKTKLCEYLKDGFEKLNNKVGEPTIGFNPFCKKLFIYKKKVYTLDVWDSNGEQLYLALIKAFIRTVPIVFVFFNYNDKRTFELARSMLDERKSEQQIFILVGTKYELKSNSNKKANIVNEEEALEVAKEKNALFAHLSIFDKYSSGVNELIKKALEEYIKRRKIN